jgi:TusA-related sulfurtransferase
MEQELKINAKGLSPPGPRLMVENALEKGQCRLVRVVVSSRTAADDLRSFLRDAKATVKVDQIGEEYHVLAEFDSGG